MSNQSCNMSTHLILFFSVPRCGLYFVLLFQFLTLSCNTKMVVLRWTSVCSYDLPHKIDRTLHHPTITLCIFLNLHDTAASHEKCSIRLKTINNYLRSSKVQD
jgi:hypothetical protein